VRGGLLHPPLKYGRSVAAAANNEKRDDNEPDPVVVKKRAKAVAIVIHKESSLRSLRIDLRNLVLTIILCRRS
jgi:hypothetical protein